MKVRLKLYGVFRSTIGRAEATLEVEKNDCTVKSVLDQLLSIESFRDLRKLLVDEENSDPRPNALIMVSGREIASLNGLDTELEDDDELALLPIAHGG